MNDYIKKDKIDLKRLQEDIKQKRAQWTHAYLADQLGLTRVGVSYKIKGERRMRWQELDRICDVLGLDISRYILPNSHSDAAS